MITNKEIVDKWIMTSHPVSVSLNGRQIKYIQDNDIKFSRIVSTLVNFLIKNHFTTVNEVEKILELPKP